MQKPCHLMICLLLFLPWTVLPCFFISTNNLRIIGALHNICSLPMNPQPCTFGILAWHMIRNEVDNRVLRFFVLISNCHREVLCTEITLINNTLSEGTFKLPNGESFSTPAVFLRQRLFIVSKNYNHKSYILPCYEFNQS